MGLVGWRTDFLGRKRPRVVHLVDCDVCEGAGSVLGDGFHSNDPGAPVLRCDGCDGEGRMPCADDGCCDFEPMEHDE